MSTFPSSRAELMKHPGEVEQWKSSERSDVGKPGLSALRILKSVVKLTFTNGASLTDPAFLHSRLRGNAWRNRHHEGEEAEGLSSGRSFGKDGPSKQI
jgi:hypothetical protein